MAAAAERPEVRVERLRASYDRRIFIDITFTVAPGTTTVVYGPSGIGKTTLVRLLLGRKQPDRGEVTVDGRSVVGLDREQRAEVHGRTRSLLTGRGAGASGRRSWTRGDNRDPVDHGIEADRSAGENIRAALADGGDGGDLDERARALLAEFDLAEHVDERAGRLPAGPRRRLGLARVFAADPALVVLDDPVARLEPEDAQAVLAVLSAARSPTLVVTAYDLATTQALADDLVVLRGGRVGDAGPAAELLRGITTDAELRKRFTLSGEEEDTQESLATHKDELGYDNLVQRLRLGFFATVGVGLLVAVVVVLIVIFFG